MASGVALSLYSLHLQAKYFPCKRIVKTVICLSFSIVLKQSYFDIWALWPWPWKQQPNFNYFFSLAWHSTLWTCTIYQTKLGYKRFSSSEDVQTNVIEILNVCCDLVLEHSIPVFSLDTKLMMIYIHTKFGCKSLVHKLQTIPISHLNINMSCPCQL